MNTNEYIETADRYLMDTYRRFPVVLLKGRGTKVWDTDGKEYLDFVGGVATNVLGHCHPKVVVAIQKQAQRLLHVSNWFHIGPQAKLGKLLVENSFAHKVFICNTGTEAVEGAIKLARKWGAKHGKTGIITAEGSFHGRTMGSLAATGQDALKQGFTPMLGGFTHVPYNDLEALEAAVTDDTCAILLEPILGESGVVVPSPGYLKGARELCDSKGILLMLDEIQTGMGRTGALFAHEHEGVEPDVMCLAKGLGGGFPIGAILANEKASAFEPGDHGTTFGGNPLACATAVAVMETLLEGGILLDQCRRMGTLLMDELSKVAQKHPDKINEVRGKGLLIGVELASPCAGVVNECMAQGLLVNCAATKVVRFMPPLNVSEEEISEAVSIFERSLGHSVA